MAMRKLLITAGVLLAVWIPVGMLGTRSVSVVPTPAAIGRVISGVPTEVKEWVRVAWQVLREGRSMPVILIDAFTRVIPPVGENEGNGRSKEGREYLDDGGDTLLVPELRPTKPASPVQTDQVPDALLGDARLTIPVMPSMGARLQIEPLQIERLDMGQFTAPRVYTPGVATTMPGTSAKRFRITIDTSRFSSPKAKDSGAEGIRASATIRVG